MHHIRHLTVFWLIQLNNSFVWRAKQT
jgi:hypothetical protein